jgi:hypothetical protein
MAPEPAVRKHELGCRQHVIMSRRGVPVWSCCGDILLKITLIGSNKVSSLNKVSIVLYILFSTGENLVDFQTSPHPTENRK